MQLSAYLVGSTYHKTTEHLWEGTFDGFTLRQKWGKFLCISRSILRFHSRSGDKKGLYDCFVTNSDGQGHLCGANDVGGGVDLLNGIKTGFQLVNSKELDVLLCWQ